MEPTKPDTNPDNSETRETAPCPICGGRMFAKTEKSTAGRDVPAWECKACGRTVLDGAAAELTNCTYQSNEVRLLIDGTSAVTQNRPIVVI